MSSFDNVSKVAGCFGRVALVAGREAAVAGAVTTQWTNANSQAGASHECPSVDTKRVLFAGGCHVYGYGIGRRYGFSVLTGERLRLHGIPCEIRTLAPLPLSHPECLQERLAAFDADVIVLQVGHWETVVSMGNYIRALAGMKRKSYPELPVTEEGADLHLQRDFRWRIRMTGKTALDWLFGRRVIDLAAVKARLAAFMDAVHAMRVSHVVVLSPFPCADPVIRRYRERLATEMQQLAGAYGFAYIDLIHTPDAVLENECAEPYGDPMHLSREGHSWMARVLADHLASRFGADRTA